VKRAAWLLAILAAASATAQVREQVTVELIEVPVYVTAAAGEPIRGLTKESFDLRVNGRRQPIEYFDAIDFAAPVARGEQSTAPVRRVTRERRLYLLLFDAAYSAPAFLARAQRAAHSAVDHANPATDLFAVATYSTNKGVQFVTSFVSDPIAIHRAIQTLAISNARDPLRISVSADERLQWSTGAKGENEALDQMKGGDANQEALQQPATDRIEDLLGNLGELATRLSSLEGQKHVLYLSTGFDSSPAKKDGRTVRILNDMFASFRAAGVFLDSIDVAGMRSKWDNTRQRSRTPEVNPSDPNDPAYAAKQQLDMLDVNESLQMVSSGTGGAFIHDANDLSQALTHLETTQQVVYILGFNRNGAKSGEISVRVTGVPLTTRVSYRQGFGEAQRRKDLDPLQLADILINDVPQSGLTLPIRTVVKDVEVAIPVEQVRAQLVETMPFVDLLIYVFDEHGAAVEGTQKRIRIDDRAKGLIVIRKPLQLPPGHYIVKAIARIEGTTSLGFAKTAVTISK